MGTVVIGLMELPDLLCFDSFTHFVRSDKQGLLLRTHKMCLSLQSLQHEVRSSRKAHDYLQGEEEIL